MLGCRRQIAQANSLRMVWVPMTLISMPSGLLCRLPDAGTVLRIWRLNDQFYFPKEAGVNRSDDLRKNAENCVVLAEAAATDPQKKRYARMATAWSSLADTQAWLDGEMEKKSASHSADA
jgi:hypothetical protein